MQRDGRNEDAHAGRTRSRRRGTLGLVLATLGTAVAVLVWHTAVRGPQASGVRDFRIVPYGSTETLGPARWKAGSPFVLRFTLAQDAYALVFHVDATGRPSLLFPEGRVRAFEGGQAVQVPPADSGEAWLLSDEAGPEWFLLVGSRDPDLDLQEVLRRMDAQAEEQAPPEATAAALEKMLRARVGVPRVVRIEVVHDPDVSLTRPSRGSSL